MSGKAKATKQEKDEIRQLVGQGFSIPDIQARYPHVDGRVISGMKAKYDQTRGMPGVASTSVAATPPPQSGASAPRSKDSTGVKLAAEIEHHRSGFTPESRVMQNPEGFRSGWQEYYVVKKLDPPNDGILKMEYPPFSIADLMTRYAAGEYEIQHYRDGRLYQSYRDKVAPRPGQPGTRTDGTEGDRRQVSPSEEFVRVIDVYDRIASRNRSDEASAKAAASQAAVAEAQAKAQTEASAISSLANVAAKALEPKPETKDRPLESILAIMKEEKSNSTEYHRAELDRIQKKAQADLDIERERAQNELSREKQRLEHDYQKHKDDIESREKMQNDFLTSMRKLETDHQEKMQALESERQKMFQENYERMIGEIQETRKAVEEELKAKREMNNEIIKTQLDSTKQIIELQKMSSGREAELEQAKIIKEGVVGSLDRIGHRVDALVESGVIGNGSQSGATRRPRKEIEAQASVKDGETSTTRREGDKVNKDRIKEAIESEWFKELKDDILRIVKKRLKETDVKFKPHGSMLGAAFLEKVNGPDGGGVKPWFHYFASRSWDEVLVDANDGLSEEEKKILGDNEAFIWFDEFSKYLCAAWNHTIGVQS